MRRWLQALCLLFVADSANAQTLRAGELLVETNLGWGFIDPASGTVGYIPWFSATGDIGRIFDVRITPGGQLWGTSYFFDPEGGSCSCAGGVGLVDPDDGSIEFVEQSPGVPLLVGRKLSADFKATIAVDEARMRIYASFPTGSSMLDVSSLPVSTTPMLASGGWRMEVLDSGEIVAGGGPGAAGPVSIKISGPPFIQSSLTPVLPGYSLLGQSRDVAIAGPQSVLMGLDFYSLDGSSVGIFAVDTASGTATPVLTELSVPPVGIVTGGGFAYTRGIAGITEIDLATGNGRIIHDGVGITRLVQIVPVDVPEPAMSASVGAGILALAALIHWRRGHA